MHPGQESPVPEKQELHESSQTESHWQGVRAGPQEGGDALRLPGTLTDTGAPGECPELPKGLQCVHGWNQEQLGGSSCRGSGQRELCVRDHDSNSTGPGA